MIPLVLNDDMSRLVQINMEASVGQGGKNLFPDITLVQAMLNGLPEGQGGPTPKLAVDGRLGPKTVAAIGRFQRAAGLRVADGRIDPHGPTLLALGRLLNTRGLMPANVQGIGPPDNRVVLGLRGSNSVTAPSGPRAAGIAGSIPGISPTDWQFRSSSGVTAGAHIFGLSTMTFFLEKDAQPGFIRQFPWNGFGVGLSAMPVGLDISFADFPSFGLRLRQGLFGSNPMSESDLQGPCTVYSVSASVGPGVALTICMFGAFGPLIVSTRAIGIIAGVEVGIPGASIMGFFGNTGRPLN